MLNHWQAGWLVGVGVGRKGPRRLASTDHRRNTERWERIKLRTNDRLRTAQHGAGTNRDRKLSPPCTARRPRRPQIEILHSHPSVPSFRLPIRGQRPPKFTKPKADRRRPSTAHPSVPPPTRPNSLQFTNTKDEPLEDHLRQQPLRNQPTYLLLVV